MLGKGIDAAKYVADVSTALTRLSELEGSHRRFAETTTERLLDLEARIGRLEADLKVARAEIRADVIEHVADRVQAAQRDFHEQLRDVAVHLDRQRTHRLPPQDG